jgi:hypothetical protein
VYLWVEVTNIEALVPTAAYAAGLAVSVVSSKIDVDRLSSTDIVTLTQVLQYEGERLNYNRLDD